jgi:hypothetical protein
MPIDRAANSSKLTRSERRKQRKEQSKITVTAGGDPGAGDNPGSGQSCRSESPKVDLVLLLLTNDY